jgi:aquaporin Z
MEDLMDKNRFIAETIGTFMLVFMGTGAIVFGDSSSLLSIAFAFGFAVAAGIFITKDISGGHFNPAVSLAMALDGRLTWRAFLTDLVAQITGALLGSGGVVMLSGFGNTYGSTTWDPSYSLFSVFVMEVVLTFILVLVIMTASKNKALAHMMGFIVAITLIALILVGGPMTGASLNPARSLAPALFEGGDALSSLWLYLTSPLLGGAMASLFSKVIPAPKG